MPEVLSLGRGHGRAIVLCVGGAREALLAEQDQFQIVLGRRLVRTAQPDAVISGSLSQRRCAVEEDKRPLLISSA